MSTVASLFSGIGGFDLGFESAGLESSVVAERDQNCLELLGENSARRIQVSDVLSIPAIAQRLKRQLPYADKWKTIFEWLRAATVFCGGFPCQDLSVAGQRAGLAGNRSGLWFVFRRIVGLFRPPWVVIENVPGLLSSNGGRDLFVILSGLAKLGYRWTYRVLDAQYFGLAQRRERVFIVASLGNYRCAEVLFERESLCWDSPPSRETGKRITGTLSARADGPGRTADDAESLIIQANDSAVRRLTPRECERLQGFPDDYTAGQSDSVRYRQLGNAVAVPVAAWIAKRLKEQL